MNLVFDHFDSLMHIKYQGGFEQGDFVSKLRVVALNYVTVPMTKLVTYPGIRYQVKNSNHP